MNLFAFALKSARFFWSSHLGTLLGAIIGTGVLTGALLVGDSVKGSLKKQALLRVGKIDQALVSGDRFFSNALVERLQTTSPESTLSPALLARGTASLSAKGSRANQVQVMGVEDSFWKFDPRDVAVQIPQDGVVLNASLASQLRAETGDEIIFRFEKPSLLTRESALSPQEDYNVVARLKVSEILPSESLGAFSIFSGQLSPQTAFVRLGDLQDKLEQSNAINTMLVGNGNAEDLDLLNLVYENWNLVDLSLDIEELNIDQEAKILEVTSPRVFLDDIVESALQPSVSPVLTYFVNEIAFQDKKTPYSMVAGTSDPLIIQDCPDGSVIVNSWLAEDLAIKAGDVLDITYYVMGEANRLHTQSKEFIVHKIVPISGPYADRSLMPDFPGVAEADTTQEWDAGFPLDMSRIRDKDEDYWSDYKGTPKAFISIKDARELWANRFGQTTALRISTDSATENGMHQIESTLLKNIRPGDVGYQVIPLKNNALKAATESFDFSSLFISFSFFLILSALILVMLFFQFGIEKRLQEIGVLSAVGFSVSRIRKFYLYEGCILAFIGGGIGIFVGKWYAQAMIYGLSSAWKDAISATPVSYFENEWTLTIGWLSGIVVALAAMTLAFWRYSKLSSSTLLKSNPNALPVEEKVKSQKKFPFYAIISLVGVMALFFPGMNAQGPSAAGMFFGSGCLLLLALHFLFNGWIQKMGQSSSGEISRWTMSIRNIGRKPKRSIAVVASLACGGFLVTAISPFQMDASLNADKRDSGTGGFALYGSSIVPIVQDLKSDDGLDFFGFDPEEVEQIDWIPLRVRDGDDASCLNLNKAQQPKVLGVRPDTLSQRKAFTFAGKPWKGLPEAGVVGWDVLSQKLEDGSIPAVVDNATLMWALKMQIGDAIEYPGPDGKPVLLRFVASLQGSMLQGKLIISEDAFRNVFPEVSGYREFFIDSPNVEETSSLLTRAMEDFGLEITPSIEVLDKFNAVQNTYLATFQLLGQLGVILGSLAIAVIALRNVLERSGELGLLEAVGFQRNTLRWQIGLEHWILLGLGLLFGLIAASIAVIPVVLSGTGQISYPPVITSLAWILISGSIWVACALFIAFQGHFKDALKEL